MKSYLLFLLLFFSFSFGQNNNSLVLKVRENQKLMKSEMEVGFQELKSLEKKAIAENNTEAQLEILNNKAYYYFTKAEYNKSYKIARELEEKATYSKNLRLMAIAKNRIGVTLNFLQVHDESEKKLKEAELFINNNNFLDKNLILANNYQFQSDLYSHLADYDKAIFYIKKVVPEYQKIKDSHEKQTNITKGYGNIGLKYLDLNIDSAAYYFQKSLKQQKVIEIKNFNVANYLGLGEVYNKKRDYEQSVKYLKKAELYNEKVQDGIYMIAIYELMQDSYKNLGNSKEYEKYKLLYLENLKTENEEKLNGVKTFVKEVREQSDTAIEENRRKTYLVVSVGILATALMVILFFALRNFYIKKKEKQIIEEELAVKEKHIENLEVKMSDLHYEVLDLAKENNANFYSRFLDLYPDFEKKILSINPKMSISELQFCALLKLNLSSKDISIYTFTSIRTVQNKKYRIRTKLNILKEQDTYIFFNNL